MKKIKEFEVAETGTFTNMLSLMVDKLNEVIAAVNELSASQHPHAQ